MSQLVNKIYLCAILLIGIELVCCHKVQAQKTPTQIQWLDHVNVKATHYTSINYVSHGNKLTRTSIVTAKNDSLFFTDRRGILTGATDIIAVDEIDTTNHIVSDRGSLHPGENFELSSAVYSSNGKYRAIVSGKLDIINGVRTGEGTTTIQLLALDSILSTITLRSTGGMTRGTHIMVTDDGIIRLVLNFEKKAILKTLWQDSIVIEPSHTIDILIDPFKHKLEGHKISMKGEQTIEKVWIALDGGLRLLTEEIVDPLTPFSMEELERKRAQELISTDKTGKILWVTAIQSRGACQYQDGIVDQAGNLYIRVRFTSIMQAASYFQVASLTIKNKTIGSLQPIIAPQLVSEVEWAICINQSGDIKWTTELNNLNYRFSKGKMLLDTIHNELIMLCNVIDSTDINRSVIQEKPVSLSDNTGLGIVYLNIATGTLKWELLEGGCYADNIYFFTEITSQEYLFVAGFKEFPPKQSAFKFNVKQYRKRLVSCGWFNLK
jgi:hypothetical protein